MVVPALFDSRYNDGIQFTRDPAETQPHSVDWTDYSAKDKVRVPKAGKCILVETVVLTAIPDITERRIRTIEADG